jgi:hypothetical protein
MKIKIENLFVFFMCKRTHEKYKQVFYFHIDFLHCLFDNEILRITHSLSQQYSVTQHAVGVSIHFEKIVSALLENPEVFTK